MPAQVTMTNRQHVAAELQVLDADGQPFGGLPPGSSVSYLSSDPGVAGFTPGPNPLLGEVDSGLVGTARITGRLVLADSRVFEDVLDVTITNADVASVQFVVGTPVDDSSPTRR